MLFEDRFDAGQKLAERLRDFGPDAVILALPRGGVPVAYQVAQALGAPLDVFIVRKIGVPGQPELAMGAIASGGIVVFNEDVLRLLGIPEQLVEAVIAREREEIERREQRYRGERAPPQIRDKTVILIDDGLATGATMLAATRAVRELEPAKLVVAVPVGSTQACALMSENADEVVCLKTPSPFFGVGAWYGDFEQTTDSEVHLLLERGRQVHKRSDEPAVEQSARRGAEERSPMRESLVRVTTENVTLEASLCVPRGAQGIVLFAHGSGSSRFSARNRFVAAALHEHGLGTLLIDLLTPDEEIVDRRTRHLRFDIGLLARRLIGAVDWLTLNEATQTLRIGLFGASTGAAAALIAAAARPDSIRALVSRGGRSDLAADAVSAVTAPTLLIVGGEDAQVIELNRQVLGPLGGLARLEIIEGASHLFPEPGALEQVAELAGDWFERFLSGERSREYADGPPP
ncbi:MAG: phosphoribosyltransferase [Bradymonadaceae bacterium]|nr:phosphoribosyltransferase [Lujinxingiaceae bacterium]